MLDRTVVSLMLRGVLTGRRTVVLAILAVLPVLAAVATTMGEVEPETAWARLVQRLLIPVIVAFVAVVIAAGTVADQRDDGTILYLVATPLRRSTLASCAVLASWVAAMAIIVPSVLLSGVIALGGAVSASQLLWPLAGAALAALAYCAAGVLAAMLVRQPVVVAVLYILLWEGTVATWTPSAEQLSIAAYGRAIAVRGIEPVNAPDVGALAGGIVLIAGTLAATVVAARRLTRTELP
jgi:ABC-2 type transport system permease protein